MKNDFLHKGIRALRDITLSSKEKEAVWSRLSLHMGNHPAPSVISPYFRFFSPQFRFALASVLIIVLVTGSGVAIAAEGALPGDVLYPVKIYIREPVEGVLLVNQAEKAQWEAEKTVRRLDEAEILEAQGRLSTTTIEIVQKNVGRSIDAFNTIVQNADKQASSTEEMNHVYDHFEAELEAHAQIVAKVATTTRSSAQEEKSKNQEQEHTTPKSESREIIRLDVKARDTQGTQDTSDTRDHTRRTGDEE